VGEGGWHHSSCRPVSVCDAFPKHPLQVRRSDSPVYLCSLYCLTVKNAACSTLCLLAHHCHHPCCCLVEATFHDKLPQPTHPQLLSDALSTLSAAAACLSSIKPERTTKTPAAAAAARQQQTQNLQQQPN
jgi:hypothetical protein